MAISSPGLGSGLNIQSIVSQLVAVEQQPVKLLQSKGSTLQTKMSIFGQIKSELSALQDAAHTLMDASAWGSKSVTSDSSSAVTGTATSSALASSFSVAVTSLASAQSVKTLGIPTGYLATATGTLDIQLGTWDASGVVFSPGASSVVNIDVTQGDSLATIAANINAKTSTAGVTATVVTTGTSQQLLIRGSSTGAAAGFQITTTTTTPATSPPGLDQFAFPPVVTTPAVIDPGTGLVTTPAVYSGAKTQTAADAVITIEGISVTSATNTVKDAIPGVTLNLLAKTTTAATISVAEDKTAIKAKIQAFQDAYNKLYADLKTQTAYNSATKTGGPLLGDSTAAGLQGMLRTLVGAAGPATSSIARLSNLGLEIQADGSIKTNSTKLDAALQDPDNVKAFFSTNTGVAATNGIAKRVYDFVFGANSIGGSVSTHSAGFQKAIDQNNTAIDKFNTHIAAYQKQLLAQYTRLDTSMSTLNGLSTFVSAQVAQWNKTG